MVAYYPEVIAANCRCLAGKTFLYDYLGIHRPKDFVVHMTALLQKHFDGVTKREVEQAAKAAYAEYEAHMDRVRVKAQEYIAKARERDMPIIVLAGRPYHLDEEICHGIDKLVCSHNAAVITEDSVALLGGRQKTHVLNQ